MSNNMDAQIRERMQERETDELLQIWNTGPGAEWTPEAVAIAGEILRERLGSLPPRTDADDDDDDDLYHSPDRLLAVAFWAGLLSWLFLIMSILLLVVELLNVVPNL